MTTNFIFQEADVHHSEAPSLDVRNVLCLYGFLKLARKANLIELRHKMAFMIIFSLLTDSSYFKFSILFFLFYYYIGNSKGQHCS